MQENRIGDIAEAAVLHDFLRHDMDVSIPFGDFPYDLVVEINDTLERVQVKSAWNRSDRKNSIAVSLKGKYDDDDFDILAIYDPRTERVFYEWHDYVGSHKFSVYVGEANDLAAQHHDAVNWPEDHTIERLKDP